MARQYKRAPVIEALCELRFASSQPLDWTIPGLLYDAVRQEFPTKEQVVVGNLQVTQNVGAGQVVQELQPKMRFYTEDKSETLQVAPDVISIHQLQPYKGWETFRARISEVLGKYQKIAQPDRVTRIALRYINRIDLPPGNHELNDYFNVMPQAPAPIPQTFYMYFERIQIGYDVGATGIPTSILTLSFGSVPPESPEHFGHLFDLEMLTPDGSVPDFDGIAAWLDAAHGHIEDAFVAAFTQKAHTELFREVES